MSDQTKAEKAFKACRECRRWKEIQERVRVAELLSKAIKAFEGRLTDKGFTPTMAEYLKLVQMQGEYDQEMAKEIKVTWVEPTAAPSSGK